MNGAVSTFAARLARCVKPRASEEGKKDSQSRLLLGESIVIYLAWESCVQDQLRDAAANFISIDNSPIIMFLPLDWFLMRVSSRRRLMIAFCRMLTARLASSSLSQPIVKLHFPIYDERKGSRDSKRHREREMQRQNCN